MVPNRALAAALPQIDGVIQLTEAGEYPLEQAEGGMSFIYKEPFNVFFTGAFGSGKSTSLNLLIDPSGQTVVAEEGDGACGQTQQVEQVFPRNGHAGHLMHRGRPIRLQAFDSPGFGDPDKSETEMMRALSQATLEMAGGIDALVHVIKKGRMTAGDRKLPELLLSGLADNDDQRRELANRWIFLVTHCDCQRKATEQASLEEFRGRMKAFFPEILHDALDQTIFVENGQLKSSPYGDLESNRDQLLDSIIQTRTVYHRVYRPVSIDVMLADALKKVKSSWKTVSRNLDKVEKHEISALIQHCKAVLRENRFLEMSRATVSNEDFLNDWNNMKPAIRDQAAVNFARDVVSSLETAAVTRWRSVSERVNDAAQAATQNLSFAFNAFSNQSSRFQCSVQ